MRNNLKDFYLLYIVNFLILPLGFLIKIFYTNTLTPSEVGFLYSVINTTIFLNIFVNLGLSQSLVYHIPKFRVKNNLQAIRNLFHYTFSIQIFLAIILSSLVYLFSDFIALNYFKNLDFSIYIKVFVLYLFSEVLFQNVMSILNAYQLNVFSKSIGIIQKVSILVFSILFFFLMENDLALYFALSWGIATLLSTVLYFIIFLKKFPYLLKFPTFDKQLLKQHFSYAYYTLFTGIGSIILNKIDIVMITYFLTTASVAFYDVSFSLVHFLSGSFAVFSLIFMPMFSELKEKKDFKTLNTILNTLYGIIFFLILPISLTFFLFPDEFLKTLFGEEYLAGASVLALFSLFSIFKIFSTYNMSFVSGLGRAKTLSKIILPVALLNVVLNLLLIQVLGIVGVAIATIVGWILLSILTYRIISKETYFRLKIFNLIKIFFLAIVFVALVLSLKQVIYNSYVAIALILAFSFTIYLILGYLLKIYQINDLYIFIPSKNLKNKLKTYHKKYFNFLK